MSVTRPDRRPSRTRLALLIFASVIVFASLVGYWAYGKFKAVIDALDCRESLSAEATGSNNEIAENGAAAAWKDKVTATHGAEMANSKITLNPLHKCLGANGEYRCTYSAQPCIWKK